MRAGSVPVAIVGIPSTRWDGALSVARCGETPSAFRVMPGQSTTIGIMISLLLMPTR